MAMEQPLIGAEEVRGIRVGKKARVAAFMFMVLGCTAYVYGCVALPPPPSQRRLGWPSSLQPREAVAQSTACTS